MLEWCWKICCVYNDTMTSVCGGSRVYGKVERFLESLHVALTKPALEPAKNQHWRRLGRKGQSAVKWTRIGEKEGVFNIDDTLHQQHNELIFSSKLDPFIPTKSRIIKLFYAIHVAFGPRGIQHVCPWKTSHMCTHSTGSVGDGKKLKN